LYGLLILIMLVILRVLNESSGAKYIRRVRSNFAIFLQRVYSFSTLYGLLILIMLVILRVLNESSGAKYIRGVIAIACVYLFSFTVRYHNRI